MENIWRLMMVAEEQRNDQLRRVEQERLARACRAVGAAGAAGGLPRKLWSVLALRSEVGEEVAA